MLNINKEKENQEKEEIIGDYDIIIEDDDENKNNISFKNEERTINLNIKDQKIENNDNFADLVPKYLNMKRKSKKKNVNKKSTKNTNKNLKKIIEKEKEIPSPINGNIIPLKEENLDMENHEINNYKNQNNKINYLVLILLIEYKKLSKLTTRSINWLEERVNNLKKTIQDQKELRAVLFKQIENKIKEIQKINEDYKEKNIIMTTNKNICKNSENENEIIHDNNNFNEVIEINNKIISDFSLILNTCKTFGKYSNMALIGESRDNNYDNFDNIPIENNENISEKVIGKTKTDIKLKKYDNYFDGKPIDLFKGEISNKKMCENMLDVEVVDKKNNP